MAWKKGPLPAGTWNWGGVVRVGEDPKSGFNFASFEGDHAKLEDKTILKADEIALYDNSLEMPTAK